MKKYQYQILRYVHDQFTGEFVNLGVVVYSPEESFLKAIVCQRYGRVNALFPNANGRFAIKMAKNFEMAIRKIASKPATFFLPSEHLATITKLILPQDDSALVLTEVRYGVDIDLEATLNDLYCDMVEKYLYKAPKHSPSDDEVWKKKYKSYFDKYNITAKLMTHEVTTKNDSFSFDKSWKNEIWHCYQPISFDLQSVESIKDKVYRWSGRLRELNSSNQKIHLTFLATLSNHFEGLNDFITQSLDQNSMFVQVDIVSEEGAEQLAREIYQQIKEHDADHAQIENLRTDLN